MKKKSLIFISIFILILVLGAIILPFITISSPQLTKFISNQLEKNLARKVEIGRLKIGILTGIELHDVVVFNKSGFKSKALIENKRLILKYRFFPLLKRQLIVTNLLFIEPTIFIERNKSNRWNFTDLLKKNTYKREKEAGNFSFQIDKIRVKKGSIYFLDEGISPKLKTSIEKIDIQIDGLNKRDGIIGFRVRAGEIGGRRINLKLGGGVEVDLDSGVIEIVTATFTLADLKAELEGGLKDELINITLKTNEFSIANIIRLIPFPDIEKLKLAGKSKINVSLNSRLNENLQVLGRVILKNGKVEYEGVRNGIKDINLDLQFTEDDMNLLSLTGQFGESNFNMQGELQNFKNPKINFMVRSQQLILDEIIEGYGEFIEAFPNLKFDQQYKLDVKGEINVDEWSFKKIIGKEFYTDFKWVRNILMIKALKSKVSDGVVEASGTIDLGSKLPGYSVFANAKQIEIANIISSFSETNNRFVCGKLSSEINIKGAGFKLNELKENLEGSGSVELKDAKIKGLKILDRLAAFLTLGVIRNLTQCHILTTFKIEDGIISSDDFELRSHLIKLLGSGKISLDLDMDFNMTATFPGRLGKQISKLGKIIPFLGDKKDRMGVRFRIKGNFKEPEFARTEEIKQKIELETKEEKEKIKEKIQQQVEKEKEEIKEIIEEKQEKIKEKAKEEVNKLFKKLF
ncbi:MAG: AsmA family protein [bacterium]